jgi:hypothetical protein
MTPTRQPLRSTLARHHGAVRRSLVARHALRAAAGAAAVIVLAVALGMLLPLVPATAWLRLAIVLGGAAAFVAAAALAFGRTAPGFDGYLERIEQRFPEIRSWLRNALDFERTPPAHGSRELAQAVADQTAERFASVPVRTLTPRIEARRPVLVMTGAILALVLLGVASPGRISQSWRTLWNPAIAAPPVRLAVEPGSVRVTPGAALAVRARVWGTAQRPRIERAGEPEVTAALEGLDDEGAKTWRFDLSQLTRAQTYRVKVGGTASPPYEISLAGEPRALSFTMQYRTPAYARLPEQRGASTRGDLTALRGSRATVEATFDRDLESLDATLPDGTTAGWTAITPRRWRGIVPVTREGEYALHARAAAGAADFRYRVNPIGDAPPILTVLTPESDLDLPSGQRIPLEIVGQDDLGLDELRLQYRKDPSAEWSTRSLARFADDPREARVATRWDASDLALLPGEAASFRFELFDGNTVGGRGRTVSPVFELRFPSMADLYQQIDRSQEGVQQALEKVSERARELQKSLDQMARQPQPRQGEKNAPNFERAEEMKQALARQQEVAQQIDEAAQELRESLEQSAERQAFNEELQRKLNELSELMEQIQSQELRDAMRRMQEALRQMDPRAMEHNLDRLKEQNREMLQHLERSIELLKQLREEEQMQALASRAEELKRQQDALNEAHERTEGGKDEPNERRGEENDPQGDKSEDANAKEDAESQRLAERQQRAAQQTEQLAEDVKEMQKELEREDERDSMQDAAEALEQDAAPQQRQAAQQSQQNRSRQAKQAGQKASQSLESAAQRLQQMAQQRQEEREGVDLAAVRRAAKDLVSLQRTAEDNIASAPDSPDRADRQTDLSEGVARVADSLYTLAQRTPFITPGLAQSLGRAMENLSTSGRELASGNRRRGETTGREAAESLNEAILELRKSEQAMCEDPGSNGGQQGGTTAQRLGEAGEQQSKLNRETRSLAQRLSEQMRLSAGDRNTLERLAEQQQRIREQIEQIQRDDLRENKLLGRLDQAEKEMKEAEEAIREGSNLGDLPQKQQRILSRLLDAQRSVHRRDFDPERESRTADEVPSISAPELSPDVLRQGDRLRLDLLKAESDRYPAQYRAFIEAYLRSLNGSRR